MFCRSIVFALAFFGALCTSYAAPPSGGCDTIAFVETMQPQCATDATGSLSAVPGNAGMPYTYAWSNGSTDSTATGLVAGTYTLSITDTAGCTSVGAHTVQLAPVPLAQFPQKLAWTHGLNLKSNYLDGSDQTHYGIANWPLHITASNVSDGVFLASYTSV